MTGENTFSAVLFDCDGVLVDSETIATQALHASLHVIGIVMTEHEVAQTFTGHAWPRCIEIIEDMLGQDIPAHFMAHNRQEFERLMHQSLVPMAGVSTVLDRLHLPFAVVTNSRTQELAMKLEVSGLSQFFPAERRFDAESMGVAKPDPAIYQRAAQQMGVDITQCLIIEDSYPGLVAGVASGATVWAYSPAATTEQIERLNVDRVFHTWSAWPL